MNNQTATGRNVRGTAAGSRLIALAACCLALLHPFNGPSAARAADLGKLEEQAIKQAAALVSTSMVRIETVGGLDRVGQLLTSSGPTTGVIVSADGFIISSAFNFISKPASILVTLADGRRLPAQQVASDKLKMLTLLKIDANDLTPATAAPTDSFRVGQWALALGKTYEDTSPSISVGIISALNRVWGKALQTDAKVSPVNYGGPLVDIQGRVLGVLVPLSPQASGEISGVEWYDSGIGFAIPLVDVYAALDRLKGGTDLLPGLMGLTLKGQDMYEGQPTIDRVRYGSPAQQAGLKEGDIVVELGGQKVQRQAQVQHALGNKYAGDSVTVVVKRGDQPVTVELTLVDKLVPYESAFLGILPVREQVTATAPGVGIRFVIPDSPAAKAGLERGQRIVAFNGTEVADAAALLNLVNRLRPGEKGSVGVQTGTETRTVELTTASLPESVPAELRAAPLLPQPANLPADSPKTGRFTDKLEGFENDYWAYVPEDYAPENRYALLVWLHPAGDTMEAAMYQAWKTHCDERGLILLAPKAKQLSGWTQPESDFVKDLTDKFLERYSIDRSRVVLHSFSNGSRFAYQLVFKHRTLFHGISTVAAAIETLPPDNEPDLRLQLHLVCGENDPLLKLVQATAQGLRTMKYPVVFTTVPKGEHKYPPETVVAEIARWIDALDRL